MICFILSCGSYGKEAACNAGDLDSIPGKEELLEKERATTSVFLPGEFHGQMSLLGYRPWGCKEMDTTEQPTLFTKLSSRQ